MNTAAQHHATMQGIENIWGAAGGLCVHVVYVYVVLMNVIIVPNLELSITYRCHLWILANA
jgi:hypothetical protein